MSGDARRPVLIGVGAVSQREEDPSRASEAVELMARALECAAEDAGGRHWLEAVDAIAVPRGFWEYGDPGRLVAERVGAKRARTQLAEIGVLQTRLFGEACRAIADGRAEVVAVCGGEAKYRSHCAERLGREAPNTPQPDAQADEVWRPEGDLLHRLEIERHLALPVRQYALIENALRHAEGQRLDAHRDEVARLWASMSRAAAGNPEAWRREALDAAQIRDAGGSNRMLAFPYTKHHNSQWNVDQAAGLIFASAAAARRAGVPESQWVHPRAVVDSNHLLPLVERAELHRCPAFGIAGRRAFERAELSVDELGVLELYSCFPVAVRVQQRELGIDPARPPSLTGGMAFAGGPLNNFVLQAAVAMARQLRAGPETKGLLTAVSGILSKQGVSLWSSHSGPEFAFDDVSDEAERATGRVAVDPDFAGRARVAGYTVLYGREGPGQSVLIADGPGGERALVAASDPALARAAIEGEIIGREVEIGPERASLVD